MSMNQGHTGGVLAALAVAVVLGVLLPGATAQNNLLSRFAKAENYKVPLSYYEGQFRGQARAMLMGKEATMAPDGRTYNLKGMRLESYRTDGSLESTVESPDCIYDHNAKTVRSASRLKLQTVSPTNAVPIKGAENLPGLFLEGVGFEWDQATGKLAVSNEVHTVLHQELFRTRAATNVQVPQPVEIFARSTVISLTNRSAIYTDQVRVVDARSEIQCELLTISGSTAGGNEITSVIAERAVKILNLQDGSRATGQRALYNVTNNLVTLTGNPAIENAQGRMGGDKVILDREHNELITLGTVEMNLHGGTTNLTGTARPPMKVTAQESRVNLTNRFSVFRGNVVADDPQIRLTAALLTVAGMEKGGGLERIHAQQNVTILNKADGSRASGDEGVFLASSNVVTLTGNAQLQNAQGKMAAQEITLLRAANELWARRDVRTEIIYGTNSAANPSGGKPLLVTADTAHIKMTNRFAQYTGQCTGG